MNHVILIGFMGCGKSSVGKALADALHEQFVDTDVLIEEQEGRKISDIFRESGEEYFRELETLVLRQLLRSEERQIIAVGGGLPVRPVNQKYLKQLGTVVYLMAQPDTLAARLQGDDTRPMLQGGELKRRIRELMDAREEIYDGLADVRVVTDGKDFAEIVKEIARYAG